MYNAVAKLHVMAEDGRSWIPATEAMLGGGGGGGGAANDRELVVTTYRATANFTGVTAGDIITCTQVMDVDGTPATVSTIWRNQTTAADLGGAPSAANIELVGATGLTNTQLRASAVPVADAAAATKLDSIIAALTTMAGYTDGLEGLAALLNGYVDGLEGLTTAMSAKLPASLGAKAAADSLSVTPASDALWVLSPVGYRSQPTVTRAANVTPYSINDVVGGVIEFTNMGMSGQHLLLTSCDLRLDIAAIPSGMTSFRLFLYNATPPSAYADNAAWELPSGDRDSYIGYIDLGFPVDYGATLFVQQDQVNKQCKLASGASSLWGYLVTSTAYTPAANSEVLKPCLRSVGL